MSHLFKLSWAENWFLETQSSYLFYTPTTYIYTRKLTTHTRTHTLTYITAVRPRISYLTTIQVRRTQHVECCWRSTDEVIMTFFYGSVHTDVPVTADQQELSSVWTLEVVWKICFERWMMRTDWKRQPGKSVLAGWLDYYIYIYIYI